MVSIRFKVYPGLRTFVYFTQIHLFLDIPFLPPANEVWGKVIFSEACVKNSVNAGGVASASVHAGIPPGTRPGTLQTRQAPPTRHPSGRYASYWNAILFRMSLSQYYLFECINSLQWYELKRILYRLSYAGSASMQLVSKSRNQYMTIFSARNEAAAR